MHARYGISSRLKEVRELLGYTQKGVAEAVGGKLRSWQDYERGLKMPGGSVFEGLARLGINVNWVLTGEGPQMAAEAGTDRYHVREVSEVPYGSSTARSSSDTVIDAEVLEDVLKVLRRYQDKRGQRWPPDHEARLAAEIYQYLIEMEQQPTPEDRAHTLELVTRILGGINVEAKGDKN